MKKIQFMVAIDAPIDKVYTTMLGLENKETYEQWTAAFNPTSTYKGSWDEGSKIYFLGVDEKGEMGGMVSEIAENKPNQFVSIRHYGLLKGDVEITEGPEVEKWANGYENYSFSKNNGFTTVMVELDVVEEFVDHFNDSYPKALVELKDLCEA